MTSTSVSFVDMGTVPRTARGYKKGAGSPDGLAAQRRAVKHALKRGSLPCARVKVHVTLHGFTPKEREIDLPEGALADDAPRALGIRSELVLVFRDERPLPGDEPLREGDRLRILRVVSGGAS